MLSPAVPVPDPKGGADSANGAIFPARLARAAVPPSDLVAPTAAQHGQAHEKRMTSGGLVGQPFEPHGRTVASA